MEPKYLKFTITNLQFTMAFNCTNPASTWVAFDYKLTPNETNAFIEIVSSNGQKIKTLQLTGNRGQKVLDTRRLSPGIYVYTLVCNNYRKTGKLIVK
jgi:hypothetical protein